MHEKFEKIISKMSSQLVSAIMSVHNNEAIVNTAIESIHMVSHIKILY